MNITEIISAKRDGCELSDQQIRYLIETYSAEDMPDSQMSAFAMAVFFQGLSMPERVALTREMMHSGKVLDWSLKFRFFDLKKIRVFVLDEADVMIATQGHQDQSIRIHKNLSHECQMMLFSATYDRNVMNFAENIVTNPVVCLVVINLLLDKVLMD